MPDTPVTYEDVEIIDADRLGLTCRIATERAFIGKYVPLEGTTVHRPGDRGRLVLPRWFVEQQGLPLDRHLSDEDVEEWFTRAVRRVISAREQASTHPADPGAQSALQAAEAELSAAMMLRARRHSRPR